MRNKLDERINGWAEQFLSVARNEVLIKSVAAGLLSILCRAFNCLLH